jgi:hypothetical protein
MSDGKDIILVLLFFGSGIWFFFDGFRSLQRKRLIENIPTSTVRGLALGLVELTGKSKETKLLKAPITGTECVFYGYTVERRESNSRSWVLIANGVSSYCPFWLDDGTGKIIVYPRGAALLMPINYKFETDLSKTMPDNLVDFMENNGLKYKGELENYSLRFSELYVKPNDNLYVLGTAKKTSGVLGDNKAKLMLHLEKLKGIPQKMLEVDLKKYGTISEDELDNAEAKVEQEFFEEEFSASLQDDLTDVIIGKGDVDQEFIISNERQTDLLKTHLGRLSWEFLEVRH